MKNPWIRLYRDALHNPKLVMLTDRQHRAWINLLLVADDDGALPKLRDIACHLRVTTAEAETLLCELVEADLVDMDCLNPSARSFKMHDWKTHQYTSDVSTDRVRKFRNKNKGSDDETAMKRRETVSETPPEAEAEAEADTETEAEARASNARLRRSFDLASLGRVSRGVSPRLLVKAEGLGLDVKDLQARATAADVKEPNALFRHLTAQSLQRLLPKADPNLLKTALTRDGEGAYTTVCQLLLEVT